MPVLGYPKKKLTNSAFCEILLRKPKNYTSNNNARFPQLSSKVRQKVSVSDFTNNYYSVK